MAVQDHLLLQIYLANKIPDTIRIQSITYATDRPKGQTAGRNAKPSARFVRSRTSPMALFETPVVSLTGKPQDYISSPTYIPVEHSMQATTIATFSQANAPLGLLYGSIYLSTKAVNVRERPKQSIDKTVPIRPMRRTGLRPIRSDTLPHCRTVEASAT